MMSASIGLNRRKFLKGAGMTALAGAVGTGAAGSALADGKDIPYRVNGKYDFDTVYDRVGSGSVKFDSQIAKYGDKVKIGMGIADTDFRTPAFIRDAMMERLEHENWGYLGAEAYVEFRETIAEWNHERYGLTVDPTTLQIATGVHPGLISSIRALSTPGSKILLMTPTYNGFYSDLRATQTLKNESEMIYENGAYTVDWDDLEARMTPDTQTMLLCNPQNPTGNVWSEEDLLRIGELCLKHQVVVLSDEIHMDLVRPGHKITPFASLPDKDIVNNSLSFRAITKTFSIPASKNAYWFSTNPVLEARVKKYHQAGINTLGVVANAAAYKHGAGWVDELLVYLDGNHRYVEDYIKENMPEVGYTKSQGTFLSWLHFNNIMEKSGAVEKAAAHKNMDQPRSASDYFEDWMVEKSGIQLNDGRGYGKGGERCMRMNIGCARSTLKVALDSIKGAVRSV
jgi:cystathionine beta-lyase|tara:strand:+ start:1675 stop:3039 length:1365 start_codon:yes stop_codon:yes gene_type:complete